VGVELSGYLKEVVSGAGGKVLRGLLGKCEAGSQVLGDGMVW
jgi:hypothetical protein